MDKKCCKECKRMNSAGDIMRGGDLKICVDENCPCHAQPKPAEGGMVFTPFPIQARPAPRQDELNEDYDLIFRLSNILHEFNREFNSENRAPLPPLERRAIKHKYAEQIIKVFASERKSEREKVIREVEGMCECKKDFTRCKVHEIVARLKETKE